MAQTDWLPDGLVKRIWLGELEYPSPALPAKLSVIRAVIVMVALEEDTFTSSGEIPSATNCGGSVSAALTLKTEPKAKMSVIKANLFI